MLNSLIRTIFARQKKHLIKGNESRADFLLSECRTALSESDLPKALKLAQHVLSQYPLETQAIYLVGHIFARQGNLTQAIQYLTDAICRDPTLAIAHSDLGNIYRLQQNYHEAEVEYRTAINIDNNLVVAWLNLGKMLSALGRFDDAYPALAKTLVLTPDKIDILKIIIYAFIYYQYGK